VLAALGAVAVNHAYLEYMLRLTIKSLSGKSIDEAFEETSYKTSRLLRDRIRKLARQRIGDGPALSQLKTLLTECKRASKQRNDYIHGVLVQASQGNVPKLRTESGWTEPPTVEQLNSLAQEIWNLTVKLESARANGFLYEALLQTKR
jgi:hypothetical protein